MSVGAASVFVNCCHSSHIHPDMHTSCGRCSGRPVGILHVTLVEAKELLKTDVFGSTDPFVEMFMPGDDKKQKSKVPHQRPPCTHWPCSLLRSPALLDPRGFVTDYQTLRPAHQVPFCCLEDCYVLIPYRWGLLGADAFPP